MVIFHTSSYVNVYQRLQVVVFVRDPSNAIETGAKVEDVLSRNSDAEVCWFVIS